MKYQVCFLVTIEQFRLSCVTLLKVKNEKKNCKNHVVLCQIQQTQWKSSVSLFDLLTLYDLTGKFDRTDKTAIFDRSCRYIFNEFIMVQTHYAKDGKIKCMLITNFWKYLQSY